MCDTHLQRKSSPTDPDSECSPVCCLPVSGEQRRSRWDYNVQPSAGPGGTVVSCGWLAHSAATSRPAAGQRQQRGVHSGVSPHTLPQRRQETLRESWQKVNTRTGPFFFYPRNKNQSIPTWMFLTFCSSEIQSLSSTISSNKPWTLTGNFH